MRETTNKPGTDMLAGWGRLSPQVDTAAGLAAESAAGAFSQ
jgi:hypothetical protein